MMLLFFGLAHLCYIWLFWRVTSPSGASRPGRPSTRCGGSRAAAVLWPHLGGLTVAVALYGLVLGGTAARATRCDPLIACGGAFFLTSDTILAFRLFCPTACPTVDEPRHHAHLLPRPGPDRGRGRHRRSPTQPRPAVTHDRTGDLRRRGGCLALGRAHLQDPLGGDDGMPRRARPGRTAIARRRPSRAHGDELRVRIAGFDRILVVRQPISKRVGAALVAEVGRRSHASPARER